MDERIDGVEPGFVEFLRQESFGESPLPPRLQEAIEERIRAELAAKRKIGWKSTALISGAATLVLGLANQSGFTPAFAALLGATAILYGLGVRLLTMSSTAAAEISA